MSGTISTEQALIYVMVMMSGVEGVIKAEELAEIELLVRTLPVFKGFDRSRLATVAQECGDMLQVKDGMATVIALVKDQLPARLRETAYALAVEVAAVDLRLEQEELRLLEMLRDRIEVDSLVTAAIEASARARLRKA